MELVDEPTHAEAEALLVRTVSMLSEDVNPYVHEDVYVARLRRDLKTLPTARDRRSEDRPIEAQASLFGGARTGPRFIA